MDLCIITISTLSDIYCFQDDLAGLVIYQAITFKYTYLKTTISNLLKQ